MAAVDVERLVIHSQNELEVKHHLTRTIVGCVEHGSPIVEFADVYEYHYGVSILEHLEQLDVVQEQMQEQPK
jgi:hypothetical protein